MTLTFHLPHPVLPALPLGLDDTLHDLSRSLSSLSRSADGPRGMYCDPEYGLGGGGAYDDDDDWFMVPLSARGPLGTGRESALVPAEDGPVLGPERGGGGGGGRREDDGPGLYPGDDGRGA